MSLPSQSNNNSNPANESGGPGRAGIIAPAMPMIAHTNAANVII
jgi:hypothetical protein